jgi:hypothetical protein
VVRRPREEPSPNSASTNPPSPLSENWQFDFSN